MTAFTTARPRLVFVSVVPSPYQRDLFLKLAERNRVDLQVYYLEHAAPDSPWPQAEYASWETVLPGRTLGRGIWRSHWNTGLPTPNENEFWVVNGSMTDVTTQILFRRLGHEHRWCFWGELPSTPQSALKKWIQSIQYAPLVKASGIVAIGSRAAEAYQRLCPGLSVYNQPYTCALTRFQEAAKHRLQNTEPVFLCCGQMIARKGIDVLLAAFDRHVRSGLPGRLILIGREADLPEWLTALPATTRDRIEYAGFKAPAELPDWFAKADVFVLPSRHDGWGVVVNQAIGSGLPLICSTAVGAALDWVKDGHNGLLVAPGDIDSLEAALARLASSSETRRVMGKASEALAAELTPDKAAKFWEKLASTRL